MYFHIVWKHIKCLPCNILIDVRKFSTTQGADTPEDKALQDHYILSPNAKPVSTRIPYLPEVQTQSIYR